MKIYTCDPFSIALPPHHSFPMSKYRLLRERIAAAGISGAEDVVVPQAATDAEILRVHTPAYLRRLEKGALSEAEIRRIGLPWSPEFVERARRSFGDGVNIAARLEGLAEAGGICISGSAFEQIENKLPLHYDYLGEHEVKNITRPVRVYRALMDNGVVKEKNARPTAQGAVKRDR